MCSVAQGTAADLNPRAVPMPIKRCISTARSAACGFPPGGLSIAILSLNVPTLIQFLSRHWFYRIPVIRVAKLRNLHDGPKDTLNDLPVLWHFSRVAKTLH